MPISRFSLCLATVLSLAAQSKPNFTGIWKLLDGAPPQAMIVVQNEAGLRVSQFIGDRLGMVGGPIDGQPHAQTLDGHPCDFLARWEGDALLVEIDSPGQVHVRRLMRLSPSRTSISVECTRIAPQPASISEKWQRQDPT